MKKTLPILMLLMVACSQDLARPKLLIASDATFAPFHIINESGHATGFDIELARAVAVHAEFEPEVVVLPYADLFSGLRAGTHDMVAATTGITAERQKTYRFSEPYFTTCQVAVVRNEAGEPRTIADLKSKRIGAAGDGTSAQAMQMIEGTHVALSDGQGVSALLGNAIDAWIVDEFDGVGAARESNDRLRVLAEGIANEQYGFVLASDRADLQTRINASLASLVNDGVVAELQARFGVERGPDWPVQCNKQNQAALLNKDSRIEQD